MDILGKARKLESRISRTLDSAVQGFVGRSPRQPIEIVQAILEACEAQVQPAARGVYIFPFTHIALHVLAASRPDKARFAAVADGPPTLRQRIIERLRRAGCDVRALELDVSYTSRAKPDWTAPEYHVTFDRIEAPAASAPAAEPAPLQLDIAVIAGAAARRAYSFRGGRIDIGRRAEVLDHRQRLVRTNHIAFLEGDIGINQSVSRKHAHIVYNPAAREYRVSDDGSARGTAVVRGGQTIPVPQGSRGTRLDSGDEIVLGQARLRVRLC